MKRNFKISCIQVLLIVIGLGCPILVLITPTNNEYRALACTVCLATTLWVYLLEQYKR